MRWLEKIETFSMCLILWALFLIVGLQFFTRYVLNDSLGWTEEIARMLLIVLTYVGAIVCARNRSHIRVDLVLEYFPDKVRHFYERLIDFVSSAFFVYLGVIASQFALKTKLELSSIEIPKSIIFWIAAVSLFLMALHFLRSALSRSEIADTSNRGI